MSACLWTYVPGRDAIAPGRSEIGGKAGALARLATVTGPAGAPAAVPRWFVLRAGAFAALTAALPREPGARRDAILALAPPPDLRAALAAALERSGLAGLPVAVRSSATTEDGDASSYAGQFESVLGVPTSDSGEPLWAAVLRVWASTTGAHALAYGGSHAGDESPAMAVLVQEMVEPVAAGVAFDADPVSGARDVVVISAVLGLGEALVSGESDADTFRIALERGAWLVLERTVATKPLMTVARDGGVVRVPVTPERVAAPALDDEQAVQVAAWTRAVSEHLGAPQDVEWALVEGPPARVVLLQARPITTLGAGALGPDAGAPAEQPAERRIWDNSNIVESYGGVTTPLTFTFARAVYEDAYRQFCTIMGVPEARVAAAAPVFANMLGLVRGRVYYPLLNWYRTLALLPGFEFNRSFMERMMGVRERLQEAPSSAGSGGRLLDGLRLAGTIAGMVRESAALPREVPRFHERVECVLGPLAGENLDARSPAELAALYRRLERELLAHWRAPLVNDFFAMMFFGILCRLIERWLPGSPPTLANDLLCGEGGIISTEPARAVMALARDAASLPAVRAALTEGGDDASRWRALHADPGCAAFASGLDAYVERFGDRCMNELKLETVTLREDPAFLLVMIRTYLEQGSADPEAAIARERAVRAAAEEQVRRGLHGLRAAVFGWVLAQARARVRDRENLRFERTRVFGVIRRLFAAMGGHLAAAGRLAGRRDVFMLTREELLSDAEGATGTGAPADFRARVRARSARFAAWTRAEAPPDRFETFGAITDWLAHDPPEIAGFIPEAAPGGDLLQGLGCCPGVVRARVSVVRDPAQAHSLAGRILVAERTDPGWTLLFPAVAGLLVQRGSLLSHSAIVAREMGIPCVVGVAHLLEVLREGDEVEMDGATGCIRLLKPGTPS